MRFSLLTGVISNSHACLRWIETTPPNLEEVRQGVERTLRDGTRAAEVISKIRSLLRQTKVEMALVNINDAIQEVVALAQPEVRKNGVKLQIDLDPALPCVTGDRVLLQQVILNLLINAIEAVTPVEREHRKLQITTQRSDPDTLMIAVSDTGIGFGEKSFETYRKHSSPPNPTAWAWVYRSVARSSPATAATSGPNPTPTAAPPFNSPCPSTPKKTNNLAQSRTTNERE